MQTGDGIPNIGFNNGQGGGGENGFNDQVSSIRILRGGLLFSHVQGYNPVWTSEGKPLGPGFYNLDRANNDKITSAWRAL